MYRSDTLFPDTTLFRSRSADRHLFGRDALAAAPADQRARNSGNGGSLCARNAAQPVQKLYGPETCGVCSLAAGTAFHADRGCGRTYHRNRFPAGSESRSEEHTSELQSLMRISYAVFCLKIPKKNTH